MKRFVGFMDARFKSLRDARLDLFNLAAENSELKPLRVICYHPNHTKIIIGGLIPSNDFEKVKTIFKELTN